MIAHASSNAAPGKPGRVNLIGAGVWVEPPLVVETDAYQPDGIRRGDVLQLRGAGSGRILGAVVAVNTGPGADWWALARVVSECYDRLGLVWLGSGPEVHYRGRTALRIRGVVTTLLRKEV